MPLLFFSGPEKLAETLAVTKDEAKAFMKSFLSKSAVYRYIYINLSPFQYFEEFVG